MVRNIEVNTKIVKIIYAHNYKLPNRDIRRIQIILYETSYFINT